MKDLEKMARDVFKNCVMVNGWPPTQVPDILVKDVENALRSVAQCCAEIAENGPFLHAESPEAHFGKSLGGAIRREFDLK